MKEVIEKIDAIEASVKAEAVALVDSKVAEVATQVESKAAELTDKITALEAKIATIGTPSIIKREKTIRGDVNRSVREQLSSFYKSNARSEKEIQLFADESQHAAYIAEASALTGSGADVGGRTAYDPVFAALRLGNPMRGVSRNVGTDGATYQFRAKTGNAGAAWGYSIQNNGAATTDSMTIWQLPLQDLNVQFPIRTAALDDIDGREANVVDDMLMEFAQAEALSMIQNNDQSAGTYGGTNGLRGLDQYGGANATYTGGTISTAAFGTSGTGSTSGLHSLATYDQLTTNANTVGAANIKYADVVNFVYSLPQQYWTESAKFVINPVLLQQIRGLVDNNGTPVFERMSPLEKPGVVGRLLGFDVVVNKYLDTPSQTSTGAAGTTSLYPMYFGDWLRGHTIVDRLSMVVRRYDQTAPGFITFFGEKRLASSVVDPFAIIRYRSTGTST